LIKQWQPWKNSTGANTVEGKAKSARNAFKGGLHQQIKELNKLLRSQRDALRKMT